jgi:coenzyme F420-reducing hydrogenase alpha subunit
MINKSVHEDEIIAGMIRKLASNEKDDAINDLNKAVDYLHSAIEIFDDVNMTAEADQVLNILTKIAKKHKQKDNSSNKYIKNLLDHGTMLSDDGLDVLDANIDEESFEDE